MSMRFRIECPIPRLEPSLQLKDKLLLMGSCFTENMGEKLEELHMRVMQNPHGILFNPISIARALEEYLAQKTYTKEDLFELNEAWHSWNHHSRFSDPKPDISLEKINNAILGASAFLGEANWLLLTFGSAFVYELKEKGEAVANCHKAPAAVFERKLYRSEQLLERLEPLLIRIKELYPQLNIMLTVSPVRHLREGFTANNRSKAELIRMVHELEEKHAFIHYFPSYELVMDDLRDYRFFAEDMVHPNYQATNYVWERFCEACFDAEARAHLPLIAELNRAARHKAFNPDTMAHAKFKANALEKLDRLATQLPELDLAALRNAFQ